MRHVFTFFLINSLFCITISGRSSQTPFSSGRWVAWAESPAERWEDAFVTGNGRHGTMVWGQPGDERITCVHEELFIRGWNPDKVTVPFTAPLLPEVRRFIEAGQSDAADELVTSEANRQLAEMGARQRWPLIPHPAFDIRICQTKPDERNGTYKRQLDLESGEVSVGANGDEGVAESVFTSRIHNVNVIRMAAGKSAKVNVFLNLEETPGRKGKHFEHNLDSAFSSVKADSESSGWLTYRACYTHAGGGYDGVARVTLKGGSMVKERNGLKINNADEVLVVIRITPFADFHSTNYASVRKELSRLPRQYDELLRPHSREHGELFRRMQFDLGCASQWKTTSTEKMLTTIDRQGVTPLFLEQMHAMGRYLLISSCGKYPPPLQGIWGGGWKPGWIGGFVWDSNINLAISAASMSNLSECALSYCNYVESLLPGWRLNAKNYLGCRGFIVAHYNDPKNGYLTHFGRSFPWMFWAGGAGWNLRPFYEYAMLAGDDIFLRERVYPLYREMADFYEDYLVMGSDSLYHITPSISPENAPPGTDTWLSRDATMDVAIAKEVFTLLLDMGRKFHAETTEMKKWTRYLEHLPSYRVNADGALAEWIDSRYPDVYNHRHLSHLYPVFPGGEIGQSKGDKGLIKAAEVALDKRFAFDTGPAHGLIHVALQAVRLGDVDKVKTNLGRFSRRHYLYNGLVTSHDPNHQTYNLDAILSFPRLLMEMLVYTEPGKIKLLPAWPEEYPDGHVEGICIFGGHRLDITWKQGKLEKAVIHPRESGVYEIACGDMKKQISLRKGKVCDISNHFFEEK